MPTEIRPAWPGSAIAVRAEFSLEGKRMDKSVRRFSKRKDTVEYRMVFAACIAVFLIAAVVTRLMPWRWWSGEAAGVRKSVVEEAWDAANTALPYAFMS